MTLLDLSLYSPLFDNFNTSKAVVAGKYYVLEIDLIRLNILNNFNTFNNFDHKVEP